MFLWTYFHEQAYRVDLTPSTGNWGRPYSKNRKGLGDIIFVAAPHVESVVLLDVNRQSRG